MPTVGLTAPPPQWGRSDDRELYEYVRQIGVAVNALMINAQSRVVASGAGSIGSSDVTVSVTRDSGEQLHARVSAWSSGTALVVGPPGSDVEVHLSSDGTDALTYTLTIHNVSGVSVSYEYVVTGIRTVFTASEQPMSDDPATFVADGDDLTVTAAAAPTVVE